MKTKIRKEVALIVVGAVVAVSSFGVNWKISSAIDQRLYVIEEQLQDIDRYLTFAKASVLEAFELSSSAKADLAMSQLMYFLVLKDHPDESAIEAYNALIANAMKNKASSVTGLYAAATGRTIDGVDRENIIELATAQDQARATLELATLFNNQLKLYQDVAEEKVKLRRELIITKNQLVSKRTGVDNVAKLMQLLGILIILAKDIVVAKQPGSNKPEKQASEQSNERLAA